MIGGLAHQAYMLANLMLSESDFLKSVGQEYHFFELVSCFYESSRFCASSWLKIENRTLWYHDKFVIILVHHKIHTSGDLSAYKHDDVPSSNLLVMGGLAHETYKLVNSSSNVQCGITCELFSNSWCSFVLLFLGRTLLLST